MAVKMTESVAGENELAFETGRDAELGREMPAGSELFIAFGVGVTAWWAIVRTILWIAS